MSGAGTVCIDQPNNLEATKCLQSAFRQADADLKLELGKIKGLALAHNAEVEHQLARSQEVWQDDLKQTCEGLVAKAAQEEPIGPLDVLSCKVEMTRERARDLDRMFYVPLHD